MGTTAASMAVERSDPSESGEEIAMPRRSQAIVPVLPMVVVCRTAGELACESK